MTPDDDLAWLTDPAPTPANPGGDAAAADEELAPAVRQLETLLDELLATPARALWLAPGPEGQPWCVRLRVDGALRDAATPTLPALLARMVTTRLKILANLDIAERRLPQSGRLALRRP